jgi:hypothetical protein
MKFFKGVIFSTVISFVFYVTLFLAITTFAAETTGDFRWAVNGMSDEGGFIGYYMAPGTTEWTEVWRVNDPVQREWNGQLEIQEGVNKYAMSSFGDGIESEKSDTFTFEWIKPSTPGAPVPTVIITFGAVTN